jgi:hypothetical protein
MYSRLGFHTTIEVVKIPILLSAIAIGITSFITNLVHRYPEELHSMVYILRNFR